MAGYSNEEAVERLAVVAPGYIPLEQYPGVRAHWKMRCPRGHTCTTTTLNKLTNGSGCRDCWLERAPQLQPLTQREALTKLFEFAPGYIPQEPYVASYAPWRMHCPKGHQCSPSLKGIIAGKRCRTCGRIAVSEKQTLTHEEAMLRVGQHAPGYLPIEAYPGHRKRKWRMNCPVGHECSPSLNTLVSTGRGCRTCANHGFDDQADGWLYLIVFTDKFGEDSVVYGKTNNIRTRIRRYRHPDVLGDRVRSVTFHRVGLGSNATRLEDRLRNAQKVLSVPSYAEISGERIEGAIRESFKKAAAPDEFLRIVEEVFADAAAQDAPAKAVAPARPATKPTTTE